MKNIHVLPTDKPSRLFKIANVFVFDVNGIKYTERYKQLHKYINQNIYITSDEEIKEGDFFYSVRGFIEKAVINYPKGEHFGKLILTTSQDLIKDGVQEIDDEFLEWFVKNPSYEEVEVTEYLDSGFSYGYKIIIPKEEPKQDMKQTAVEWLYNEIKHIIPNDYIEKFEQAKEIEEENICDAYNEGLYAWDNTDDFIGIDYYNKKFKNK